LISIDLDNTIACYDAVFSNVAVAMELIDPGADLSKSEIKQQVVERFDDREWQRLQGKVYGKYMHTAEVFPGFMEFLLLARLRGEELAIVSHKTEYGHFDEEKFSLRKEAADWLKAKGITGRDSNNIHEDNLYFCDTREAKVEKINALGSDALIDDLSEILEHSELESRISRILFAPGNARSRGDIPSLSSWREISSKFFGPWAEDEILQILNEKFPWLDVTQVQRITGRANSEVFVLGGNHGSRYLLKIYPDMQHDRRTRLLNEVAAVKFLKENGLPVPAYVASDSDLNWAVFEFIDGEGVSSEEPGFHAESMNFISALVKNFPYSAHGSLFPLASEACLKGDVLLDQVRDRIRRLQTVENQQLADFLDNEFRPQFDSAVSALSDSEKALFSVPLEPGDLVLSPSDFGSHNAVRDDNGAVVFIDFEYFGWDDPVKLVSDYFWHPGMQLSSVQQDQWLMGARELFAQREGFMQRLDSTLPFFGYKWCLILLNEFMSKNLEQKVRTGRHSEDELTSVQRTQLQKARHLLTSLRKYSE